MDGDDLYLEPSVAYRVIQTAAREMGDPFSIAEQTLRKRLHEKKLLASIAEHRGTLTVRRTLAGSVRPVLHLLRSALLPESPEEDTADSAAMEEAEFVR